MAKYVLKRILLMLFTLFVILTMCFVLIKALPLPALKGIGKDVNLILMSREKMGYGKPVLVQYFLFLKGVLTEWNWGLGEQMYPAQNVWDIVINRLPYTMVVNLYSILIAIPIGLAFGIFAALKKNKWQDHVISLSTMILISVPSYVYCYLIQYFLCFKWELFPLQIYKESEAALLSFNMFYSMVPAIIALGLGVIAGLTRYTRAELSEVLTQEFMLLARTKGLTKSQAISRHALRNAMVVILPMIIGEFIGIIGGSLIIEQAFGIPGVGSLYITSINVRDYNFFMALTSFYTFIGLLSGIVIDISYGFIDPRIRMGSKK